MKSNHEQYNRRRFIKSVSLGTAIVALSPNFAFGKVESNHKLSISFSNTPLETIINIKQAFLQYDDFLISEDSISTDVHYVHSIEFANLEKLESVNKDNIILIINHRNFDNHSLDKLRVLCNRNNTFLLMIEEPTQESMPYLFSKATLYEPHLSDTNQINTIIKLILVLNQLTQQNQFFTLNHSLV